MKRLHLRPNSVKLVRMFKRPADFTKSTKNETSNSIQPTFKPCRVSVWSSKHKFVVKSSGDQI